MATIRSGISDIVNDLNKARNNCTDPYLQVELQKVIKVLFILWELTIYEQMDKRADEYKQALEKIKIAKQDAKQAVKDMQEVVKAIKSATTVAKAVDKIIGTAIKLV